MGGTWAVGYFRHVFRGPNFPVTKTKVVAGIKKMVLPEKSDRSKPYDHLQK
jgi:hypothetical protein